jgi:hypothetical protein
MEDNKTSPNGAKRTGRLATITQFIKATSLLIWSVVAFIIVAGLGYHFFLSEPAGVGVAQPKKVIKEKSKPVPPVYNELDKAVEEAGQGAADASARLSQLDKWDKELRERVDNDFLPWYFSYWNTQIRGVKALYYGAIHWADSDRPSAAEKHTEEFQLQFTTRVLQPHTSQKQLERIQVATLEGYLQNLRTLIADIPKRYKVSAADWENYLTEISIVVCHRGGGMFRSHSKPCMLPRLPALCWR